MTTTADTELARRIGMNVLRYRADRRFTGPGLAIRAGTTARTVANVENGLGVSVTTLMALADALGVTANDLVAEDEVAAESVAVGQ